MKRCFHAAGECRTDDPRCADRPLTFFDRCRTLFMLDRDTLDVPRITPEEARDLASAFFQTYPEVQRWIERRLRDNPEFVDLPDMRMMPAVCNLRQYPEKRFVRFNPYTYPLKNPPPHIDDPGFFYRYFVVDDLVGEKLSPIPGDFARALKFEIDSGEAAYQRDKAAEEARILGAHPTLQLTDDTEVVERDARDHLIVDLMGWLRDHASPSHQVTAERMLKEWDVGDFAHAGLVHWFLDNWSPSHRTTAERLVKNYVVTRKVAS